MFCTKCGTAIEDGKSVCPKCNAPIGVAAPMNPVRETQSMILGMDKKKFVKCAINIVCVIIAFAVYFAIDLSGGPDLQLEAPKLLKQALEENVELTKYVSVGEVKECVLVKESKNKHSGLAKVVFRAKKNDSKGRCASVIIQYGFDLLCDGDNIMLQNGVPSGSDETKLTEFLMNSMGEDALGVE